MAFKQTRPMRMKGPLKRSNLINIGSKSDSDVNSGVGGVFNMKKDPVFYNSKMGPMQMHSASALKQMEEEMTPDVSPQEPSEEKAGQIFGQEIRMNEDGTFVIDSEYGISGVPDNAVVKDPNGVLVIQDGYVMDENYTYEVEGNTVIITGIEGEVDPDAPGTPGEEGYEPPVKREDLDEEGKAIYDKQRE